MVDKEILEAIKAEIRKLKDNPYFMVALKEVGIIDSLQEGPDKEKLNSMLDENLSNETAESWNKRLQEESVSNNMISVIDKQAKRLWNEINTGHEYSIIDSYNQFYGICMEIAESVKKEPVSLRKQQV